MATQIQGATGIIAEVDASARALRMSRRPVEFGALGYYRVSGLSGTMAAGLAADAEILQARWADATRLALIHRVTLDGLSGSATAFTAGFAKVDLRIARAWTVDGSGGTDIKPAAAMQKMRTSMGNSLFGGVRVASTAALVAGTKTLDGNPSGLFSFTVGTVVSAQYAQQVVLYDELAGDMPMVLANNEGIVARATLPATGTWQFGITIEWSEVASF